MKILMIILAVLLLVGGLAIIGLVASGSSSKTSESLLVDAQQKGAEATKKWERTKDPVDKVEADKWIKLETEIQKTLDKKKSESQMGFLLGGVLLLVGGGIFGLSFVFGKRKE